MSQKKKITPAYFPTKKSAQPFTTFHHLTEALADSCLLLIPSSSSYNAFSQSCSDRHLLASVRGQPGGRCWRRPRCHRPGESPMPRSAGAAMRSRSGAGLWEPPKNRWPVPPEGQRSIVAINLGSPLPSSRTARCRRGNLPAIRPARHVPWPIRPWPCRSR